MKKKRSEQTLRAGCSKAEPKIFAPPQTPFQGGGGAGRPKFNQPETVTIFTYKPSLVKIDARDSSLTSYMEQQITLNCLARPLGTLKTC